MNVFSSPAFLRALDTACFDGHGVIEVVEAAGHPVQTLVTSAGPCVDHLFIDFFEPTLDHPAARSIKSIPRLAHRSVPASDWAGARGEHTQPSPYVAWRTFGDWAAFEAHVGRQRAKLLADTRRQTRRLEKELGPVRVATDHDAAVFDRCVALKSQQYQRTGARDLFSDQRNVELLRRLAADGLATTEALWAGDTLVAAHIGMRHEGRYSWWFPAYEPDYERFSPGRVLLVALLKDSYDRGDTEFDFLLGDEEYKWHFATDVRLVDSVGSPSLSLRLDRMMKQAGQRFPRARNEAKKVRARVRARRANRSRTRSTP